MAFQLHFSLFLSMAHKYLAGHGFFIIEALLLLSDTPHLLGILWTRDLSVAQNSTCQQTTLTADGHPCLRRDSKPKSQQKRGRSPKPQAFSHRDRLVLAVTLNITQHCKNRTFRSLALLMHKKRRILLQHAPQM